MEKKDISDQREEILRAKKKLAMFIAGGVTFLIFCSWLVYFLNKASKISTDSKGGFGSFMDDVKKNAGESFSKVQDVAGELNQKVKSVGDYYTSGISNATSTTQSTSTSIGTTTEKSI